MSTTAKKKTSSKKTKKEKKTPIIKSEGIVLTNQHLTRQLDIIPLEVLGEQITIIGAGAIGSWTALSLAKMGFCNIRVIDYDTIEIENMNCQFYPHSAIGQLKVVALKDLVKAFTNIEIEAIAREYIKELYSGIVISAVDSMKVRKLIWDNHKEISFGTKFIIDPRMGAESALLYTMSPLDLEDIEAYENTLYTDENSVQERCTAKSTIYTANLLSGLVSKTVKDIVTKNPYSRSAIWAIKENIFKAWPKENKNKSNEKAS